MKYTEQMTLHQMKNELKFLVIFCYPKYFDWHFEDFVDFSVFHKFFSSILNQFVHGKHLHFDRRSWLYIFIFIPDLYEFHLRCMRGYPKKTEISKIIISNHYKLAVLTETKQKNNIY